MRRIYTTLVVLLMVGAVELNAQDLDFKGGLNIATQSDKTGLFLGVEYGLTPEIDLAGGFTFFSTDKSEYTNPFNGNTVKTKTGLWMFDINGNYYFPVGNGFTLYPLAGINLSTFSWKVDDERDSDTELGLNLGGGAAYDINETLDAFVELKYILGDADQACIGLGVLVRLN